jgi:L-ribulose-5-phosphate 3-epimerase UlaE
VVGFDFVDLQADEADAKASNNNAAPTASAQVPFEHRIKAG